MHEIDMASPSLGWEDDDAYEDALIDRVNRMSDQELLSLELEASFSDYGRREDAGSGAAPEPDPTGEWLTGLSDAEFSTTMTEADLYGDRGPEYLDFSRDINATLVAMTAHEAVRQAEDADDRARRSGPHHNRRTVEETMARAIGRYSAGTYVYGQVTSADLANTMFDEGDFTAGSTATPAEIRAELDYQLRGGIPPARRHRQPLPPVHSLGRKIGLR